MRATWRLETGNGTSALWLKGNNAGGIKCTVDRYCHYKTKEAGIQALTDKLEDYVDEFGYDLKAIRYKYCGSHCGQKDLDSFTRIYNEELERGK